MPLKLKFGVPFLDTIIDNVRESQQKYEAGIQPAFKKASIYAVSSIHKNFDKEGRPTKWAPLSKLTRMMRSLLKTKRTGGKGPLILQSSGKLRNSILPLLEKAAFGARTNLRYAWDMHFGMKKSSAKIKVPKHKRRITQAWGRPISPRLVQVQAYTMNIGPHEVPARPFMVWQDKDIPVVRSIFLKQMEKARGHLF